MTAHATPTLTDPARGPVRPDERVELLDVLRGFALLGILLVNFWGSPGERWPALDRAVSDGLELLVSESFYPLFSFLFGLGFAVQLLRARERGARVVGTYVRRLLALFVIGTVHAVLIWDGDVLTDYALLGLVLVPLHRLPPRAVLAAALLVLAIGVADTRVTTMLNAARDAGDVQSRELAQGLRDEQSRITNAQRMRVEAEGGGAGYAAHLALRWHQYGELLHRATRPEWALGNTMLACFLLGLYAGRRELIQRAAEHRRGFAWATAAGLAIAAAGMAYGRLVADPPAVLGALAWDASNLGLTAAYVALIALAMTGAPRGRYAVRSLRALAPAGRMALTNYLMQSVVMTMLFLSYGFGLDEPPTTAWLLLNVAFFALVQVPLSHWWLARFRFGPAEWAWRAMTYGERPAMRRDVPARMPAAQPVGAG